MGSELGTYALYGLVFFYLALEFLVVPTVQWHHNNPDGNKAFDEFDQELLRREGRL